MAESGFTLEVATPERLLVSEQVTEAQIPGLDGYMGVEGGHAPLISELANGILSYKIGGKTEYLAIYGGFVEILPDKVRVMADGAQRKTEVEASQAKEELAKAYQAMENPPVELDPANALAEMQRAQAKVDLAEKTTN